MKIIHALGSAVLLNFACTSTNNPNGEASTGGSSGATTTVGAKGGSTHSSTQGTGGVSDSEETGGAESGGAENRTTSSSKRNSSAAAGSSAKSSQGGASGNSSSRATQGGTLAAGGSSATPSNSTGTTPVDRYGQLKVEGGKLVDKSGNPVQLKGPSSMWLNWETQKFAEDKQGLQYLRDNWNASLVRAAMGIDTTDTQDNDYLRAPEIAKAQVNQIVQNAIDLGMYVIIDWHDGKAETRTDTAKAFFSEMATKWGSYPNVLYETFNEPTKQDWKTVLKPYHETIVSAIRAVDEDNVIILGTPNWSQFVDVAAESPVTTSTNLMYTLHFYSCTHDAKVRDLAVAALAKSLPIFVTEWGATHADGGTTKNPNLCLEEAQVWHDWMNQNKISWAAWKWDRCVDKTCYFNTDVTVRTTGPWTDEMLNGHAPFVRDRMRE